MKNIKKINCLIEELDEPEIYDGDYDGIENTSCGEESWNGVNADGIKAWYNPEYYENVGGVMVEKMKDETKAQNYVNLGMGKFGYVDETVKSIPSAFYRPVFDNYNNKAFLERRDIIKPKLYKIPDETFEMVYNDIKHFWESKEKYKQFGNVYKRNILLYSVPGNGKTSMINLLAFELIEKYNGIIITINEISDLRAYSKNVEKIRMIEPERPIITIIEDFDSLVLIDKTAETLLLQLLDGNNQFSNIVTIATTNYIEQLKPSFLNRPSRFNICAEYKKPNEKVRRFYITNKLNDSGIDISSEENNKMIDRLVKKSEGFTFDHMKELLEMIFVGDLSEDEAYDRIKKVVEAKGKYKITEDGPNAIGFDNDVETEVINSLENLDIEIRPPKIGW